MNNEDDLDPLVANLQVLASKEALETCPQKWLKLQPLGDGDVDDAAYEEHKAALHKVCGRLAQDGIVSVADLHRKLQSVPTQLLASWWSKQTQGTNCEANLDVEKLKLGYVPYADMSTAEVNRCTLCHQYVQDRRSGKASGCPWLPGSARGKVLHPQLGEVRTYLSNRLLGTDVHAPETDIPKVELADGCELPQWKAKFVGSSTPESSQLDAEDYIERMKDDVVDNEDSEVVVVWTRKGPPDLDQEDQVVFDCFGCPFSRLASSGLDSPNCSSDHDYKGLISFCEVNGVATPAVWASDNASFCSECFEKWAGRGKRMEKLKFGNAS